MRISKRNLRILIENYLNEQDRQSSTSEEIIDDGDYRYKRNPKTKYGWSYSYKEGPFKAINKKGGENLDAKYGSAIKSGSAPKPKTKSSSSGAMSGSPITHLQSIADAEYPGKGSITNQKKMTQIGPAKKPYPRGSVVTFIQKLLKAQGFKGANGRTLVIDGEYGPSTDAAVKAFQNSKNISVDTKGVPNDLPGIVGYQTAQALLDYYKRDFKGSPEDVEDIEDVEITSPKKGGAASSDIERAHQAGLEQGGAFNYFMKAVGMGMKGFAAYRKYTGWDQISGMALEALGVPYHYLGLLYLAACRSATFQITGEEAKIALYHICKNAEKNGKTSVGYKDYYNGQPGNKQKTYTISGFSSSDANEGNVYGQLSVFLGKFNFTKNSDGSYSIVDQYDYNVYRRWPKTEADFVQVVPTIANYSAAVKKLYDAVVNGIGSKASGLEPLLVVYEASMNYPGYEVTCKTATPEEAKKGV